jgi:hypothetical protein
MHSDWHGVSAWHGVTATVERNAQLRGSTHMYVWTFPFDTSTISGTGMECVYSFLRLTHVRKEECQKVPFFNKMMPTVPVTEGNTPV